MEPAGLALGVIALAGLFNNAVDCFEYVQLGRNFSTNFHTSIIKLDTARLRLSRWGQAVGLGGDVTEVQSLDSAVLSPEDVKRAEILLGQIQKLFADAEGVSDSFKVRTKPGDSSLDILDAGTELDAVSASLHEKMRLLSIKRQNKTSLKQKVKWALYKEKDFKRLIEDVIDLVNDLVEVFPAAQNAQQQLCETEVSQVDRDSLPILQNVASTQDKDLETAIIKILKSNNTGLRFTNYNSKIGEQVETKIVYGGQITYL